jgi:Bromodomain extra-terminal - transcription regulation
MTANADLEPMLHVNDTDDLDIEDSDDRNVDIPSGRRPSAFSSGYSDSEEEADYTDERRRKFDKAYDQHSSSDSDDDEQDYMPPKKRNGDLHNPMSFTERREAEELILDRITNHLTGDKLPGILAIIQMNNGENRKGSVEIDLSSLTPPRLRNVLAYVEACMEEQQGGPKVDVSSYILQETNRDKSIYKVEENASDESTSNASKKRRERRTSDQTDYVAPKRKRATKQTSRSQRKTKKSLIDLLPPVKPVVEQHLTESIDAASEGDEESPSTELMTNAYKEMSNSVEHSGPISLADFVSASETNIDTKTVVAATQRKKVTKKSTSRSFSAKVVQTGEDSIAGSRPKRLAALQSMSVVEDLLGDSTDEDEGDEEEEQVSWQQDEEIRQPVVSLETIRTHNNEEDDDDDDIDVLE